MPITFVHGNFWDTPADVRVNAVNCVGVMGKGIALEFKNRYPEMFLAYKNTTLEPGRLHLYKTKDILIINFPTKRHWHNNSQLSYIEKGLRELRSVLKTLPSNTIVTIPALGCGNGGLKWVDVKQLIIKFLSGLDVDIKVFEAR